MSYVFSWTHLEGEEWRDRRTYPFIPFHVPEAHCYMIRSMTERSIWERTCCMNRPVGRRCCRRSFKIHWCPYCTALSQSWVWKSIWFLLLTSWFSLWRLEAACFRDRLLEIRCTRSTDLRSLHKPHSLSRKPYGETQSYYPIEPDFGVLNEILESRITRDETKRLLRQFLRCM